MRASWRPSTKTQCFATFAKTELGGLQQNPNVLPSLSWRPSKPRNIHAGLLTAAACKNTPFYPSSTPKPAISHQNPNVLLFLSWRPSKPPNIHACLLTAKFSKSKVFSPAHTTTWRPSKITNSPSRQSSDPRPTQAQRQKSSVAKNRHAAPQALISAKPRLEYAWQQTVCCQPLKAEGQKLTAEQLLDN
ncbi:MAG: hypothetical protein ACP5QA_16415 [Phycisphaerae bacterium]